MCPRVKTRGRTFLEKRFVAKPIFGKLDVWPFFGHFWPFFGVKTDVWKNRFLAFKSKKVLTNMTLQSCHHSEPPLPYCQPLSRATSKDGARKSNCHKLVREAEWITLPRAQATSTTPADSTSELGVSIELGPRHSTRKYFGHKPFRQAPRWRPRLLSLCQKAPSSSRAQVK